ncbi:unnamed protein product [Paramecium octaurelia]|uniref:Uncharacterized protein n=1 Tax=Paramecium octaurelia TaxID=43137 RepID=A0A8S1SJJ0_PAROT|nr:unnamed protein product [Paramecium octaurelia]
MDLYLKPIMIIDCLTIRMIAEELLLSNHCSIANQSLK